MAARRSIQIISSQEFPSTRPDEKQSSTLSNAIWVKWFVGILALLFCQGESRIGAVQGSALRKLPTEYTIIVTGSELLRGIYADKHTHFLTRTLESLGCRCLGSISVGDRREDLMSALDYAQQRSRLILVTGGLGPTDDDITREVLARHTGIALREHPDLLKHLRSRAAGGELPKNMLRQTWVPTQGSYLPNSNGTAAGLIFDDGRQVIIALPGPPRELVPMVRNQLIPYLAQRFGVRSIGCSLTLRFAGLGESNIQQTIHAHLTLPDNLTVTSLFESGRVDLTFSLPGNTSRDRKDLEIVQKKLLEHTGEYMYSDDGSSLEDVVLERLSQRGETLVVAEVGTGGAIAASLSNAKDAKQAFSAGLVAPSDSVMAVLLKVGKGSSLAEGDGRGDAVARAMARRASMCTGSEWALAVAQEGAAAGGSKLLWVAVRSPGEPIQTCQVGPTWRGRLVTQALDFLRRRLER